MAPIGTYRRSSVVLSGTSPFALRLPPDLFRARGQSCRYLRYVDTHRCDSCRSSPSRSIMLLAIFPENWSVTGDEPGDYGMA